MSTVSSAAPATSSLLCPTAGQVHLGIPDSGVSAPYCIVSNSSGLSTGMPGCCNVAPNITSGCAWCVIPKSYTNAGQSAVQVMQAWNQCLLANVNTSSVFGGLTCANVSPNSVAATLNTPKLAAVLVLTLLVATATMGGLV